MGPIPYSGKNHALLTCGILFCLFEKRAQPTLIMYRTWNIPRRNETPGGGGLDDPGSQTLCTVFIAREFVSARHEIQLLPHGPSR